MSSDLENRSAQEVIAWAIEQFHPRLTVACSFGAEDAVIVDMIARLNRDVDIFYLDTNLHFEETYETRDRLAERYGVRFRQVLPLLTLEEQAEQHGERLWERDPDRCCALRKVEPLKRALAGKEAWITGIRREQAPTRANAKHVEWDARFGLVKCNPLARWTHEDVWKYIEAHDVPYNALHDQNYPSIGCWPCTRPVAPGEDPRAGRWSGFQKTECGLHK